MNDEFLITGERINIIAKDFSIARESVENLHKDFGILLDIYILMRDFTTTIPVWRRLKKELRKPQNLCQVFLACLWYQIKTIFMKTWITLNTNIPIGIVSLRILKTFEREP